MQMQLKHCSQKTADLLPAFEREKTLREKHHKAYRSMIGSLLYLVVCTKPDVLSSVSVLARQLHASILRHMNLVTRIFRYIAGTVDYGLQYSHSVEQSSQSLVANVDADWDGYKETRKSTSDWIIAINGTTLRGERESKQLS